MLFSALFCEIQQQTEAAASIKWVAGMRDVYMHRKMWEHTDTTFSRSEGLT